MKRILAIAWLNLIALFRDRTGLIAVIVLPLMLTWVFGAAFGSQGAEGALIVPVTDLDGTRYSQQIVVALDGEDAYDIEIMSEDEARTLVKDGDAPVAIIVPKGFGADVEAGGRATVLAVRYPGAQNGQAVVEVVQGVAARVAANAEAARAVAPLLVQPVAAAAPPPSQPPDFETLYDLADGFWEPEPPVGVDAVVVTASDRREAQLEAPPNTQYSLGFTVFFVFMTALGSADSVLEDRELGTLRRILAAPARRAEILAGKVGGVALVAAFEASILVVFGALVFGVPWGNDPVAVAAVLVALVLAATGLGVMTSALVRTRAQLSALGPVLSTGLAMLGGCYWPIEITTPTMQTIAKLTPTGWAMAALTDVVARGMGLADVILPVAALLAFAITTIGIGVTRLRLE